MRRKNKTVTLQWEPFTGQLTTNGVAYLSVAQTINNVPPYPVSIPMYLQYKGVGRMTHVKIDPTDMQSQIKFYLNTDGSSDNTEAHDLIFVPGGNATWIVDE